MVAAHSERAIKLATMPVIADLECGLDPWVVEQIQRKLLPSTPGVRLAVAEGQELGAPFHVPGGREGRPRH